MTQGYNIAYNGQDKSMYKYMNLEQKLVLYNVNINFNKMFLRENIISEHAKVNIKTHKNNTVVCANKTNKCYYIQKQ